MALTIMGKQRYMISVKKNTNKQTDEMHFTNFVC